MVVLIAIIVGMHRNHTDIDGHVISQVLIARNKGSAIFILETDPTGNAVIYAIEILDRSYNGVRGVVGEDLNSHWNARSHLRVFIEEQLERDVFGQDGGWGRRVVNTVGTTVFGVNRRIRGCGIAFSCSRLMMCGLHGYQREGGNGGFYLCTG